jgi:hypothetical protein
VMAATVALSTRPTIRTRQSRTDQRPSSAKIFRKLLIVIPGTPPTKTEMRGAALRRTGNRRHSAVLLLLPAT